MFIIVTTQKQGHNSKVVTLVIYHWLIWKDRVVLGIEYNYTRPEKVQVPL